MSYEDYSNAEVGTIKALSFRGIDLNGDATCSGLVESFCAFSALAVFMIFIAVPCMAENWIEKERLNREYWLSSKR